MSKINYKFNEGDLIKELQNYIDSTYDSHYSRNKFQSTEFINDCGHGMGFAIGNVLKYASLDKAESSSPDIFFEMA